MFFFMPSHSRMRDQTSLETRHWKKMCPNYSLAPLRNTHHLSGISPSLSWVRNLPCANNQRANLCLGRMQDFQMIGFHGQEPTFWTKKSYARGYPLFHWTICRHNMAASVDPSQLIRISRMRRICLIKGDSSRCQHHCHTIKVAIMSINPFNPQGGPSLSESSTEFWQTKH